MDFLIWSGMVSFVTNSLIGIYVFSRDPRNDVNKLFLILSGLISGWSVGSSLINLIEDKSIALNVLRFNYAFAVFLLAKELKKQICLKSFNQTIRTRGLREAA